MAEGFAWPPRQKVAVDTADPAAPGTNPQEAPADSQTLAALIYGG